MTTHEAVLHPAAIVEELKKNDITHVVWLPDSETNFMYHLLTNEPSLDLVPVCREGETMAIAAGLWVGGMRPVVLIQNTGIFESGDSIRGLGSGRQSTARYAHRLSEAGAATASRRTRRPDSSSTSSTLGASTTT